MLNLLEINLQSEQISSAYGRLFFAIKCNKFLTLIDKADFLGRKIISEGEICHQKKIFSFNCDHISMIVYNY